MTVEYQYGTDGNDTIYGNEGSDALFAGIGNDYLYGEYGNDYLFGQEGNDTHYGQEGNDTLYGGSEPGNDYLDGGNGNDILYGEAGNDTHYGGNGNDTLYGWSGKDTFYGGSGNDILYGEAGNDTLDGGLGQDIIFGGAGNDLFVFAFGESLVRGRDRLADFAILSDKIDLLTNSGKSHPTPVSLSRAADTTASDLFVLAKQVFVDSNGAESGNQPLGVNSAAIAVVTSGMVGTYLIVNDFGTGFNSSRDLVISITGYSGTLPVGSVAPNTLFV